MPLDIIQLPPLLFPAPGADLTRFAVIACDQFTAEPSLLGAGRPVLWAMRPPACG